MSFTKIKAGDALTYARGFGSWFLIDETDVHTIFLIVRSDGRTILHVTSKEYYVGHVDDRIWTVVSKEKTA